MASLAITADEIYAALGAEMGVSRDPDEWDATTAGDAARIIRSGKRRMYSPPPTENGMVHKWTFLDQVQSIFTVLPFSTGTVTVVSGVATLSAGAWPVAAISENSLLVIDGAAYEVATRTSNAVLTLVNTTVDAPALTAFQLVQYRYALPTNFGGLNAPVVRVLNDSGLCGPEMLGMVDHVIRGYYAKRFKTGEPTRYAVQPLTDPETAIADWYLVLWPVPVAEYELKVEYHINPGDGLDQDPALAQADPQHSETLLSAILSAAEIYWNNNLNGPHSARFQESLLASISRDKMNSGVRTVDRHQYDPRRHYPIDLINAPLIYPVTP